MEILISTAYFFLVRLVFFDYRLLRFNLIWKFIVFGIYLGAVLAEITLLGQFVPYSKEAFAQAYVVQMAPERGGRVNQVFVSSNEVVKKGDPLFQMDPEPGQNKVDEYLAQLAAADTTVAELDQQVDEASANTLSIRAKLKLARLERDQVGAAAAQQAASLVQLEQTQANVDSLEAQLDSSIAAKKSALLALDSKAGDQATAVAEVLANLATARYNLEQTTIRAPSDGYATNMQLHPGSFVRIKAPIMSFVSSDETWIIAKIRQQGSQRVRAGDKGEVAFDMYPGKVFPVVVESVAWASGNAQGVPGGILPTEESIAPIWDFAVRLRLENESGEYPLRFGASALVAIYSSTAPDFLILIRQLEIRSESYLKYLFNPF
jgi:multidrug resistance efflux pump